MISIVLLHLRYVYSAVFYYYSALFCAVLHHSALCCAILRYAVLCCAMLRYAALYCAIHCTIYLLYTILTVHYISVRYIHSVYVVHNVLCVVYVHVL